MLQHVNKEFDGFAIKDVSFSVPAGCITGFVGENGAGKSTILKLILNLLRRDSGEIQLLGKDAVAQETALKEQIGVVFDESNFPENFRAADVNAVMRQIYHHWDETKFASYLRQFDLPAKKIVKEYSRGMKMKLSLAVALSHHARLLLLDEATSGLDPVVRDDLLDIFLDFIQEEDHSVFLSTHIISDLARVADHIILIHKGELIFSRPKDALLEDYALLHCEKSRFHALPPHSIVGARQNEYGVEALVRRQLLPSCSEPLPLERPNLEDIMLYHIRHQPGKNGGSL